MMALLTCCLAGGMATAQVTQGEYYWDTDPGVGLGSPLSLQFTAGTTWGEGNFAGQIQVPAQLQPGLHTLYVRAYDAAKGWGQTAVRTIWVQAPNANITAAELFVDTDPGPGKGLPITLNATGSREVSNQLAVATAGLAPGFHRLYVRSFSPATGWGLIAVKSFWVIPGGSNLTGWEYFYNTDPGEGNGKPMSFLQGQADEANFAGSIPTEGLLPGSHILYVRAKNGSGSWSQYAQKPLVVLDGGNKITAAEYFWDTDPGTGLGQSLPLNGSGNEGTVVTPVSTEGLSAGYHTLYVRTRHANGSWGQYAPRTIWVKPEITAAEYFIDKDPGTGNGKPVAIDASGSPMDWTGAIAIDNCLSKGQHFLYVRVKDSRGNWSWYDSSRFTIDQSPAALEIDSLTTLLTLCPDTSFTLAFSTSGRFLAGNRLRAELSDEAGNFSNARVVGQKSLTADGCKVADTLQLTLPAGLPVGNGYRVRLISTNPVDTSVVFANPLRLQQGKTYYRDADGDGYGTPTLTTQACSLPVGYVADSTDCNDNDAAVHTSFAFYTDADGDGYGSGPKVLLCSAVPPPGYSSNNTDCDDNNAAVWAPVKYYADADGDGFGSSKDTLLCAATAPPGFSTNSTDCNDADNRVWTPQPFFVDADGDGYGSTTVVMLCAATAPAGYSTNSTDCNDADAGVHTPLIYYADADGDGIGAGSGVLLCAATPPAGYSAVNTDCDDTNAAVQATRTFYIDADGDGFGSGTAAQLCTIAPPAGYSTTNTDCNDADSLQKPGQTWYLDADGDGYGTGSTVVACLRPANGRLARELKATTGDCNDNDARINPGRQMITYSRQTGFDSSFIAPLTGSSYTSFVYEIVYTDSNNQLPPAGYPRVLIDYENNGVFTDPNDRAVVLSVTDVADLQTADGKAYRGSISQLITGSSYRSKIVTGPGNCASLSPVIAAPRVLVQPDLQVFANDINFSENNPAPGSELTVSVRIHNVSDYVAENFEVKLINQYDTTIIYPNQTLTLPARSSQTVEWTITTPADPAWCPMQVIADATGAIEETNELDNTAIRPFINGNYNLPGAIVTEAKTNPEVGYATPGTVVTLSGQAWYTGTAVPLTDSSVAGAQVSFTLTETGQTFSTITNSRGQFSYTFERPLQTGVFHITGTTTDFTLTGKFAATFTLIDPPCKPDLVVQLLPNTNTTLLAGQTLEQVHIRVRNTGCAPAASTNLQLKQTGGSPALPNSIIVPALAPGEVFQYTLPSLVFSEAGNYNIWLKADATLLVEESSEDNNELNIGVRVLPNLPDITIYDGTRGQYSICNGATTVGFTLTNTGGVAAGPFTAKVVVWYAGQKIDSVENQLPGLGVGQFRNISFPYTYSAVGTYTFEVQADIPLPGGVINETNETNNNRQFGVQVNSCPAPQPNLSLEAQNCQQLIGIPGRDPKPGESMKLIAKVVNTGNAAITEPIKVNFMVSGVATYTATYTGTLLPGRKTDIEVTVPVVPSGQHSLTVEIDPDNVIAESNERDNTGGPLSLCYEFSHMDGCFSPFWSRSYVINQSVQPNAGIQLGGLYLASAVEVQFEVEGPGISGRQNLGRAVLNNPQRNCTPCPNIATLPENFVFLENGIYTFTITIDPDNKYPECTESNNVRIVTVRVENQPDMRILSQYINPSKLNPDLNEPVELLVTYENIGANNISDRMRLKVLVNDVEHAVVNNVAGLVTGDNATVKIPVPWSSGTPGVHIIRAVIDANNRVAESNELNNEATRAIVAGQSANLKFGAFTASNAYPAINEPITLEATLLNNGDVACAAEVWFGFVTTGGDTSWFRQMPIEVSPGQTRQVQVPWFVANPVTTLVASIKNSSVLEFTYDDNTAFTYIGQFTVAAKQLAAACTGLSNGILQAEVKGGSAPYTYKWSNGGGTDTMMATAGNYNLTVTDAEGREATMSATLGAAAPLAYYRDADGDGYGNYSDSVKNCGGAPVGYVANALDCDDANPLIGPAPIFVMDGDIEIQGNLDLKNPQRPDLFPCWNGGKLVLNGKSLVVRGTITGFDLNHFIVTDGGSCLKIINNLPENTFPIGTSASSPNFVKIANSGAPDAFCVGVKEAVLSDGTTGDTIRTSVVNRTWDIEETVPGGSNATITMYWGVQDEAPGFNRNLSAAAHYHQGFWETGPVGSAQAEAGGQFSRTQQGFTSFSPFTVTSGGNAILPVKLVRFDAKATPAGAELEWVVAQVTGTVNFEIHRSTDGRRFEQIGVVPARQNGLYRFTDVQKEGGTVYYRLKITDQNGKFEWGPIRKVVHQSGIVSASIYPNPVSHEAFVVVQGLKRVANIRFTITDTQGRVIVSQQASWNETGRYRLETSRLAAGQYLIKVDTGAETLILKMIKE